MYFDFEDYHPDITPVGRAISWREGVLISIIVHLVAIIVILLIPRLFPYDAAAARARALLMQPTPKEDTTFVFVQPRLERPVRRPPEQAAPSDLDRAAQSRQRAPKPNNPLPYNRGNSPERVDTEAQRREAARGRGPQPDPAAGQPATQPEQAEATKLPDSQSAMQLPSNRTPSPQNGTNGRSPTAGGSLGDALRPQRYAREAFEKGGGGGRFGPEIEFDTKGEVRPLDPLRRPGEAWFIHARVDARPRRDHVQRAQDSSISIDRRRTVSGRRLQQCGVRRAVRHQSHAAAAA
jgi:hypothetical protein